MSDSAIQTHQLGKRYRGGEMRGRGYLRDAMRGWFRATGSNSRQGSRREEFWALRDVDLRVNHGEVLGVIGRNGAGKTTLLKILSRITRPTSGEAEIRGRVGSLLEVGTGFHPELTGRENTYLSGAILGMSKKEISTRFDEIVAFAEIERFIDMPVKHYSSGMFVRLAFAVAAHLEPDILLVDEVLAVGDVAFQRKCLGKMGDVSRTGRTILFVSHNMGAIGQLCQRCLLLRNGRVEDDGPTGRIVDEYLKACAGSDGTDSKNWDRTGSGRVRIGAIEVFDGEGRHCTMASMGREIRVRIGGEAECADMEFSLSIQFVTASGIPVLFLYDQFRSFRPGGDRRFLIELRIPRLLLMPGVYYLHVWIGRAGMEEYDWVKNAIALEVLQGEDIPITLPITHQQGLVYGPLDAEQLE
jgi:lipopolysaccharide transport system ATP-binding protein